MNGMEAVGCVSMSQSANLGQTSRLRIAVQRRDKPGPRWKNPLDLNQPLHADITEVSG